MKEVFLGKPFHWLVVAVLIFGCWLAGRVRLHVTDFNLYVILLALGAVAALALVLRTTGADEQVTRDRIDDDEAQEAEDD